MAEISGLIPLWKLMRNSHEAPLEPLKGVRLVLPCMQPDTIRDALSHAMKPSMPLQRCSLDPWSPAGRVASYQALKDLIRALRAF